MTDIDKSRVWILGRKVSGVGKSINWIPETIPSFADCDILIVDTTTLTDQLFRSMNIDDIGTLFGEISKRFRAGLMIVCISSESFNGSVPVGDERAGFYSISNYFWSPAGCAVKKISTGKTLKKLFKTKFLFESYVDCIDEWDLALISTPIIKTHYSSTSASQMIDSNLIASNSNDLLGGEFTLNIDNPGIFFFLPQLKTPEESVKKLLDILGIESETPPPPWIKNIEIPGTKELHEKISEMQEIIKKTVIEQNQTIESLREKNSFLKLVYETDTPLEKIVEKALNLIGFKNVRHKGESGKDDIIFDFTNSEKFSLCSIDAKGITGNLKIKDLRQLDHWVDDHAEAGISAKGVILANTFRLIDLNESKAQRSQLEKENLDFAIKKDVCLFPSHVLLDLCIWILSGNEPNLEKIENAIKNTAGFLKLEDLI